MSPDFRLVTRDYPGERDQLGASNSLIALISNLKDQLKHVLSSNTVHNTVSEESVKSIHYSRSITTDHNSKYMHAFKIGAHALSPLLLMRRGQNSKEISEMCDRNCVVVDILSRYKVKQ